MTILVCWQSLKVFKLSGKRIESEGLCTYEYARAVGPHSFTTQLIPENHKLPLDFFTYQIINLNENTQLLLTKADIVGQTVTYTLHIRHLDRPAEIYTDVSFDIISHQVDDFISPTGKKCNFQNIFHGSLEMMQSKLS